MNAHTVFFIERCIKMSTKFIQREKIDVNVLYKQLEERGRSTTRKVCCGRTKKRRDFYEIMKSLGYTGNYMVMENGNIVGIIDLNVS